MNIEFKKVKDKDKELLFKWANDKDVRQNSFNKDPIKYEDHTLWFNRKINSLETHIFVCYLKEMPVGQVRIEVKNDIGLIGYSIDRHYRGRALGTYVLTHINEVLENNNIKISKLLGRVTYENIYSQKAFLKAEFKEIMKENYIEYVKYLGDCKRLIDITYLR